MKKTLNILAILFAIGTAAHAQVVPTATGPRGLPVSGNLDYTFRYSQTAGFYGASQGDQSSSIASGDVDYANANTRLPFNLNYGGGYIWTLAGPSDGPGLFQHLLLSQGIVWRKWKVSLSDDVSYRPQSPTTGFSGIPGIGEPIGGSGPAPPSSQSILTLNTRSVDNAANGEFGYQVNYATALSFGGNSELLRYPDGNGLDTNAQMADAALTRRLNAQSSLTGNYTFSQFSYPDYNFSFVTNSVFLGFKRALNRKVTTGFSAGPQWTGSSDSTTVPSSIGVAVNAAVNYQFRFESASLVYSRGVRGGAGYLLGATVDSVNANFSRELGRDLTIGLTGSYQRTAGLQNSSGVTNAEYGGVQATRRLGRYLNVFANYTAIDQSSSLAPQLNVLNQFYQVIGIGIAYSPRETHLRH
jgi:hypothetical protein